MKAFISYRRDDSAGHTGRLYDSLRERFGQEHVFLDHSGIESGQNYAEVIQNAVRSCDVLLAVIGREWLTTSANGSRRLDNPGDLVRTEIVTAFERGIPVIPVLVNHATPPPAEALPEPLKPLAAIDVHEVSDERWAYDVDRLIAAMEKLGGAAAKPRRDRRAMFAAVGGLLAVALVAGAFVFWPRATSAPRAADLAGEWTADVTYDWGATHPERFNFIVDGTEVLGTASFLKSPRGIVNGSRDGDRVVFETQTEEVLGDWNKPRDIVHRYRGRITGDAIAFTMQSSGGTSSGVPIQFTAKRAGPGRLP